MLSVLRRKSYDFSHIAQSRLLPWQRWYVEVGRWLGNISCAVHKMLCEDKRVWHGTGSRQRMEYSVDDGAISNLTSEKETNNERIFGA